MQHYLHALLRISARSFLIFPGIWFSKRAAGVFGLCEYLKVCTLLNSTVLIKSKVSLNSSSVSPGKPTIISVVIEKNGSNSLSLTTREMK